MKHNDNLCPVILAGGSGTRLWPLSRSAYPKQFLDLTSDRTMLQDTIIRLKGLTTLNPIVVCGEEHRFYVKEQFEEINIKTKILLEPLSRNTAPAITIAALMSEPETIMLVLPADHLIEDINQFHIGLKKAIKHAKNGNLVTFGISPNGPNTNYGYMQVGNKIDDCYQVSRFVEKPDIDLAVSYINEGGYYWNSGIFVFKASSFLEEIKKYEPEILKSSIEAYRRETSDDSFSRIDLESFSLCPSKSIDYAVMEKTNKAILIPLNAGWTDLGTWDAVHEVSRKNTDGNFCKGDVINSGTKNSFILSTSDRLIATIGLNNFIVIDTKDAVFISPKNDLDKIKNLISTLKDDNKSHIQFHREVHRPWGKFDSLDKGQTHQVKKISVNPGAKLSLQKHKYRSEHWIVINGTAEVTRDDETFLVNRNESVYLPLGCIHSLKNPSKDLLELIEVQTGTYLGEDDIERFEDIYGRVK